ncbi:MAG: hypothetical protein ACRC0V_07225 [Fusobacteriaceae bacterium]|uniref:hypothetical protein n=1 Tax=Romboutsia sp. TaxID=1965302 RepID=UPI003F413A1A
MWYKIKKYKDILTVTKTETIPVFVTIYVNTPCDVEKYKVEVATQEITSATSFTLNRDFVYKIIISKSSDSSINFDEIFISNYYNLLTSIIEDVNTILCGCECYSCNNCNEADEKTIANTLTKVMLYYGLVNQLYIEVFNNAFKCSLCTLTEANLCMILNENITGNSDNTLLMKKLISFYYLAFYYAEISIAENVDYTNIQFDYEKIKKCISNLGLSVTCIEDINQPPSIGDGIVTITAITTKTFTIADFTTNTIPPYSDTEGDELDAIRIDKISLEQNASLKLNNISVTENQIITADQIALGLFKFTSSSGGADISTFLWSARDKGSLKFSS